MKKRDYNNLEQHFIAPKVISPFFGEVKRLPRKVKKLIKKFDVYMSDKTNMLSLGKKYWFYLSMTNPEYASFIVKQICKSYDTK